MWYTYVIDNWVPESSPVTAWSFIIMEALGIAEINLLQR